MMNMTLQTIFPFEFRIFELERNDSMIIKDIMPTRPDYVMGNDVDFTLVDGQWIGPDNRKTYAAQEKMLLSNCCHMVTVGQTKQIYDNKEFICDAGEGGWFYMPRNILDVPITTDSTFTKILAIDYMSGFIDNRTMYNLAAGDTLSIQPSEEAMCHRYVVVAEGTVVANETHNLTGVRIIRCRNPVNFVSTTNSILVILDIYARV